MKVSYLHIRNYKQFSDLELDLTYPKGHVKAGKPLDKICIIGQSGTGKTNLLDIITKSTVDFSDQPQNTYFPFWKFSGNEENSQSIQISYYTNDYHGVKAVFSFRGSQIISEDIPQLKKYRKIKFSNNEKSYFAGIELCKNISEEFFDEKELEGMSTPELQKLIDKPSHSSSNYFDQLKHKSFIQRSIVNIHETNNSWKLFKDSIDNYENEKNSYTKKLSNKLLHDDSYTKENFKNEMKTWEKKNENFLEKIADDINMIIQKFNLELHINEDTQSYEELIIKDLSNNTIIEYDDLSTGTKNLLSTFIPLKSHKPKDSIILIDEPEMSFYPNIQRQLTDLYMDVGENNQLIMATHSPLIASSFEPWEVVELKFDKNNQIYREKYYDGENHVDNYTLDPRMLTWTSILVDIFDLKEDSFSLREKKLMEYGMLKAEIKAMEKNEERDEKIKKFKKLSALLGLQN